MWLSSNSYVSNILTPIALCLFRCLANDASSVVIVTFYVSLGESIITTLRLYNICDHETNPMSSNLDSLNEFIWQLRFLEWIYSISLRQEVYV
jgi:hypothetical protein